MADEQTENRFLILFRLNPYSTERLAKDVPRITETLARLSSTTPELAFRSDGRDIVGWFIKTSLKAGQIPRRLESPGRGWEDGSQPFLTSADAFFIIELGRDLYATPGFTRAATWLQRK